MNVEPYPLMFGVLAAVGTFMTISLGYEGAPVWLLGIGSGFSGIGMYVVQRGILADQRLQNFQEEGRDWSD